MTTATDHEHAAFLAQVTASAEAYWTNLTGTYGYQTPPEGQPSVAGRFEDFIGYMINWSAPTDESITQPDSLRDLYEREGFPIDREAWPRFA